MAVKYDDPIKDDFRNFLYVAWKHLHLPEPTPVQYEIAYWLQHGTKKKILEAFRGIGKSWITSAYVCWSLLRDPQLKFLVVSASSTRANDFSTFTKRLINEMPKLQHLKPENHQRDSNIAFDVAPSRASHSPSVKSVGVFGQMTGSRADEIIADDVEVPNNSYTQDMREKLSKRLTEFTSILKPDGKITYLGTPQTEESIYNKLRERGFTCRIYPARYPSKELIPKYSGALAKEIITKINDNPDLIGKPVDPLRFNELDLLERETEMGRSNFALQFMLDTSLSDAEKYPLKLSDLITFSVDSFKAPQSITWTNQREHVVKDLPALGFSGDRLYAPLRFETNNWVDYEGSLMAIDPSGRGSDETSYFIVKQIFGYLYVTDFGGVQGGYEDDTLEMLAKIARTQKVNDIVVEANFGDGMFTQMFKRVLFKQYRCNVEEVKHHTQKERRIIDVLEPVMNSHKLIVSLEAILKDVKDTYESDRLNYSLLYQLTRITKERGALKHDDRLDCLAMAVAYWVEWLSRNSEQAKDDYLEELREAERMKFIEDVVNFGEPKVPSDTRSKYLGY